MSVSKEAILSEHAGQTPRTQKVGRVVSNKMDKTVVVAVDFVRRHRLYHKRITRTSKFMAHDERNECKIGDVVRIEETRPMSRHKNWIVREVLEHNADA
jgi:small subunit ribosomal protein S17